ncbi:MAG: sulfoxide reductase heme-binding subunit YedZ [Gemmatimonadetes bacterium]|nr:sulfoxide reductase heme-binding subunit YedZ [Gemmatimonadota bacterium]
MKSLPLPLPLPAAVLRFAPPARVTRVVLFVASCLPLLVIAGWLASDLMFHTRHLGSNPIKEAEHMTGEWTLRFLMFTLAVTPLRQLLGWNWLAKHRRTMGLFAFAYGSTHLLCWALLDVQLDWMDIVTDIMKRWYILIGMTAWLLMLPLAATSTAAMIRRLGKNWAPLHNLVFATVVLGCIHFFMAVKRDIEDPLLFASIFAVLLGWRVYMWWRRRQAAQVTPAIG